MPDPKPPPPAAAKPRRLVRWLTAPTAAAPHGVLRIIEQVNDYFLQPIAADFGRGFALTKLGSEDVYHVLLDPAGTKHHCDCRGFLRWNRCKHVEALLALIAQGQLPDLPVSPPSPTVR